MTMVLRIGDISTTMKLNETFELPHNVLRHKFNYIGSFLFCPIQSYIISNIVPFRELLHQCVKD